MLARCVLPARKYQPMQLDPPGHAQRAQSLATLGPCPSAHEQRAHAARRGDPERRRAVAPCRRAPMRSRAIGCGGGRRLGERPMPFKGRCCRGFVIARSFR
jgi:hypothetical protein